MPLAAAARRSQPEGLLDVLLSSLPSRSSLQVWSVVCREVFPELFANGLASFPSLPGPLKPVCRAGPQAVSLVSVRKDISNDNNSTNT